MVVVVSTIASNRQHPQLIDFTKYQRFNVYCELTTFIFLVRGCDLFLRTKWYMQNGGTGLRSAAGQNRRRAGETFTPDRPQMQTLNK